MRHLAAIALLVLPLPALAQDGLTLHLRIDDASARTLAARGERVVVRAWFYGEPASPEAPTNPVGLVDLGIREVTVAPESHRLTFPDPVPSDRAAWVAEPYVNVNVFTARLADDRNLLDCASLDEPLARAALREPVLLCRLSKS